MDDITPEEYAAQSLTYAAWCVRGDSIDWMEYAEMQLARICLNVQDPEEYSPVEQACRG